MKGDQVAEIIGLIMTFMTLLMRVGSMIWALLGLNLLRAVIIVRVESIIFWLLVSGWKYFLMLL